MDNSENKKENCSVNILQPELCSGCGTCEVICPMQAITMFKDDFGFLRPKLDDVRCVNCGLCSRHCIMLNPRYVNVERPKCFAVMAEDSLRKISSSGGIFTLAAEYIISQSGYVCGAVYDNNFNVEHIITNQLEDLERIRGSKYMQSRAGYLYPQIKTFLEENKYVLFTGTPCQVGGLNLYLGKEYPNLYTIDLFCHGITSWRVFEKYHQDVLKGKKIERLEFKAKEPWGWRAGVNAWFSDGSKYSQHTGTDPYFLAYLQNISENKACEECKANCLPRQGDLSIGDFWQVEKFDRSLNDGKGTSAVLVNNSKGDEFFKALQAKMLVCKEIPLDVAIEGNGSIVHSYKQNKNRTQFFNYFHNAGFEQLQKGCSTNRIYEQIYIELTKRVPKEEHEFYFLAKFAVQHARGRKIVTWIKSEKFEKILEKYFGYKISFAVSKRKEMLQNGTIENINILIDRKREFYLVAIDPAFNETIYEELFAWGYKPDKDFVFRKFKPIVINQLDLSKGNYYDSYNNSIEGYNTIINKVILRGFNNHIMFGNRMDSGRFLTFDLAANSFVEIGERTRFNTPSNIEVRGYDYGTTVKIGNDCFFDHGVNFRFFPPAKVFIGERTTSSSSLEVHANMGKRIIIGKDCMFSYENELWAGDGHSILDVKSGQCINRDLSGKWNPSNSLVVGDHVWCGKQAFLMQGSNIGQGSIVGARCVVKGNFPNNCVIAGNPARKIKENIAWSRSAAANDLTKCGGGENARLTLLAQAPVSGRNVLVIGGTRFMGKELVKNLLELGNDVTIANRGQTKDSFGMHVDRLVMDIGDAESVKSALRGKYYDVIFNNLAYCSKYVDNVLSQVEGDRYIQLSSVVVYPPSKYDLREELFDPYKQDVEINDESVPYHVGKRAAETILYKRYPDISAVTVRIPFVTKTERLFYYCENIAKQLPMKILYKNKGCSFIREVEVGKYLPWIAAQKYSGPINLASEGIVTISMIISYIESKLGKRAIIDIIDGLEAPFNLFKDMSFSMNMSKSLQLGYKTSNINDWFWDLMDEYIARAKKHC